MFKDILISATNFILSECFNVITKECSYNLSLFNLHSLCLTFPVEHMKEIHTLLQKSQCKKKSKKNKNCSMDYFV